MANANSSISDQIIKSVIKETNSSITNSSITDTSINTDTNALSSLQQDDSSSCSPKNLLKSINYGNITSYIFTAIFICFLLYIIIKIYNRGIQGILKLNEKNVFGIVVVFVVALELKKLVESIINNIFIPVISPVMPLFKKEGLSLGGINLKIGDVFADFISFLIIIYILIHSIGSK